MSQKNGNRHQMNMSISIKALPIRWIGGRRSTIAACCSATA
jgi:hypothetical protein